MPVPCRLQCLVAILFLLSEAPQISGALSPERSFVPTTAFAAARHARATLRPPLSSRTRGIGAGDDDPPHFSPQKRPFEFSLTKLSAKKKSKKATRNTLGNRTVSTSGFGGAAVEPCPCGSGLAYSRCCGRLHKDANAFGAATAEQVVRARYSAYAKREVDFIVGSTHPLNKDFKVDIQHWKNTIKANCYDNFELKACNILSEEYEGEGENEIATVQFVATMIQVDSREKTSFMETSKFERGGKHIRQGAWLYKSGVIEPVQVIEEDEQT